MLAVLMLFTAGIQDPDFWWHLRIGRWMVENGRLPSHDLFTFTVPDHLWTDHEYLTEVLMWLVYSATGAVGIAIAFGLVTWAGFWLIYRQVRRQPFVIVGLGLALGALAGWPIWGPRAQMITFAFSCLQLYWLQGYLSGRSRALNFFPLVMAAWANLHGGWVIGFAWLGVALVAELVGWAWDRSNPAHRAHVRFLAIITAASLVAVLATPHGFSLYLYPFQTQGSVAQQKLIVEWFSPDFHQTYLRPFEAMVFIVIAGFALRRPRLYEFLLTMAALGLALQSVRHVALFVAAATPVMVGSYSEYWKELASSRGWKLRLPARPLFAATTAVVLVLVFLVALVKIDSDINPTVQAKLDADSYPIAAADWLAAHPEVGTRMYNQYGWGGYLAYRFYPDPNRRVFIFGEAELMGDPLLNQYNDVQNLRPDWKAILDQYRVDYVIFNKGEALSNVLATQPEWTIAYQDNVAVIFVRTKPS
ncbi:MAG: hypothetical protein QOJ10_1183 [Chloroflexota bacterium]|nr:hypothetical protein [Chloroflexota bacterium]